MSSLLQDSFDQCLSNGPFGMPLFHATVWPSVEADPDFHDFLLEIRGRLGECYKKLSYALLRKAFLIELVELPGVNSTKMRARWSERLAGDPRAATFENCREVALRLTRDLAEGWLDRDDGADRIRSHLSKTVLPYEAPFDYVCGDRRPIHVPENVLVLPVSDFRTTLELRAHVTGVDTSPDAAFFRKVLKDKIKVKSYLTDRAQTGPYKTNREKRWEAHPESVQFARRATCLNIERVLIEQICRFEGFPAAHSALLRGQNMIPEDDSVFRCPITLDPLDFNRFRAELQVPTHGRAEFQVGHLDPLKFDVTRTNGPRHNASNISWISADGNRIQGSRSLDQVRELLQRVIRNYREAEITD